MSKKLLEQVESVLNEAQNPQKKTFIKYAKEILENILKIHNLDMNDIDIKTAKQVQQTIISVLVTMGGGKSNANYSERKKYMPKKYDTFLFDNGDGNDYGSAWWQLLDTQHFTIAREAFKQFIKEKKPDLKFDINGLTK